MKTFSTKDIHEAVLLFAFRVPLIEIQRDNGICYFVFEETTRSIGLIEAFWRGDLTGNIRDFVDAQRRAKDLIFRNDGNGDFKYGKQR